MALIVKSVLMPCPCSDAAILPKSPLATPINGLVVFLVNVTPDGTPPVPLTGEVSPPFAVILEPVSYCNLLAVPVIADVARATAPAFAS